MSAGTIPELEQASLPAPVAELQLADLCQRFESLCANAVDYLEIAAGLEAEGFNDQTVRVVYGFPDVFALAEDLHRRVSRNPTEPEPPPDQWRTSVWRHVVRGILFGLPSLCYPVAAPLLSGVDAVPLLVVSTVASWSLSQALSFLGFARLGRGDRDGGRRLVRVGLGGSALLLLVVVGLTAVLVGRFGPAAGFAVAQGGYLLAATVLLVDRAELWLLVALAPGVLASTAFLLLGEPAGLRTGTLVALAGSLLLTVVLAVGRTSWPVPAAAGRLRWAELRATGPYLLFGAVTAGLLAFPLASGGTSNATMAVLPLSLSMGAAEWLLYRYRGATGRLLRRSRLVKDFATRSWWPLIAALTWYLLCTAVLMVVARELGATVGVSPQWTSLLAYEAYLSLGGALFLALLLQAFCGPASVVAWCGGALATELVVVVIDRAVPALRVQLLVCGGLLLALVIRAGIVLGQTVRHR
ncbi:MAG TPA: hypothetical protein VGD84_24090 [Pseudonocardiaceae bacterium]